MKFLSILVYFLYICIKPSLSTNVIYAVNCGGPAHYSKYDDIHYKDDRGYNGGKINESGKKFSPFPYLKDDKVYQTQRYTTENSLQYILDLDQLNPGKFVIVLKLSEVTFREVGKNLFGISVGNILYSQGLDIFSIAGFATPLEVYIECEYYENGKITLNDVEITNGYSAEEKKLILALIRIKEDPKINAIVVYQGNLEEIPKIEKFEFNSNLERMLVNKFEEAQKIIIDDEILGEYLYFNNNKIDTSYLSIFDSIYRLTLTKSGLVTSLILVITLVKIGIIICK
ncbi:uncharacterized protein CMU_028100 [Cryptosporidium muris RN66]|uniref:Malectin domain-containing protein n=1 Tax=Cryptosporidium muris (strain RN66) TaxID=441375 RepID=B6ABP8_CRYMR|nr:uncharacterized protein CMU_028100 [Cryptosporidium muris RN66]EEA05800.1 hypothetical protein, conserved [Cryptosporidium muris RN66]|eukprot:XP_002140149.1 hypothetical protein [Cryptosporidium muris RN66]